MFQSLQSLASATWLQFENPAVFWALLIIVPFIAFCATRSYADLPRRRLLTSAALRVIGLLLIVFALGKPVVLLDNTQRSLLFLLDVSDSISTDALTRRWQEIQKQTDDLGLREQAGLIVFAGKAELLIAPSRAPFELERDRELRIFHRREREAVRKRIQELERQELGDAGKAELARLEEERQTIEAWRTEIGVDDTDLEAATRLARATLPIEVRRRLYLYSDGNETRGEIARDLRALRAGRFSVLTALLEPAAGKPEIIAEQLRHPAEVKVQEPFDLELTIQSSFATKAEVKLYRDKFLVATHPIDLEVGSNLLAIPNNSLDEGFHEFEAVVVAPGDTVLENNTARGAISVAGRPRILLIDGDPGAAHFLEEALASEDVLTEVRPDSAVPQDINELLNYDVLVLSDVAASSMTQAQMSMIKRYVHELGGGLVMLGGERSFGLGGYYRTPIEEALPVRMPIRKNIEKPNLALILVVDKSGSMGGEKIELAKESAIASAEVLKARDSIGVIAFDSQSHWICPMTDATDVDTVTQMLSHLTAAGGTNIYPALNDGYQALLDSSAKLKHIILLTDGQTTGQGYQELVTQIAADDITVSTVGIGQGADTQLLTNMARWGHGEYYFTAEFAALPQIITRETLRASKSMLIEEPFVPKVVTRGPALKGVDLASMPFLLGYVATSPKQRSQVSLVSDYGDPVLASWNYGLGRSVAYTSDAKSRWAGDWIGWEYFSKFWAQLVRSVMSTGAHHAVQTQTRVDIDHGIATMTFDVRDTMGEFLDAEPEVAMFGEDGNSEPLPLTHVAPGLYETEFPIEEYGKYYHLLVVQRGGGDTVEFKRLAVTEAFSPEFRSPVPDRERLQMLARETGGQFEPSSDETWQFDGAPARTPRDTWWWWLIAAAFLLPIDIAVRRLG